jgi:Fe-S-cluster containining protein
MENSYINLFDYPFEFDDSACNICNARCCSGESGIVRFSKTELLEMSNFLKISTDTFLKDYCKKDGYTYILKEIYISFNNYKCIFLTDNRCNIYSVRPQQCRTFPYWKEFQNRKNLPFLKNECIGVKELLFDKIEEKISGLENS